VDDVDYLGQAIALATANVADGGGPFGAIVVRDGVVLAQGQNRVTRDNDPTAHAEVVAIRRACAAVGDFALQGAVLYASCEPCPLCLAAVLWSRLDRVVFAADRHAAAESGFDDRAFYELFEQPTDRWERPRIQALRADGALEPFDAWRSYQDRIDY